MILMTSEPTAQLASRITDTRTNADTISYAIDESALGEVLIARTSKGVCAILIGDDRCELGVHLACGFPTSTLVANEALVRNDLAKVLRFIDKPVENLNLALDMRGTPFQHRVWEKLRAIPIGRTVSYTDVAYWVGPLTSARAVAGACASNPIALAVPCHRVVRSNGDLAGYRWGVERKREILRREALAR